MPRKSPVKRTVPKRGNVKTKLKRKPLKRTKKARTTRAATIHPTIKRYIDQVVAEKFAEVKASDKRIKAAVRDILTKLDKLEVILRKLK